MMSGGFRACLAENEQTWKQLKPVGIFLVNTFLVQGAFLYCLDQLPKNTLDMLNLWVGDV